MVTHTELYRFYEQASGTLWTYTSGVETVAYLGDDYTPAPIGRKEFETKNELTRANLDVTLGLSDALSSRILATSGETRLSLTIFERDKSSTMSVVWKGRLTGHTPDMANITLAFESIFTSLRRPGLRARYQKTCRHALYGKGCRLDPEDFATAGTLAAIDNRTITVAAASGQPDGYYLGGMVRDPSGALAFIVDHVGSDLTLQRVPYSMAQAFDDTGPATVVSIYPGCDHSLDTCWSKFDNGLNCGCFKWIPTKNPMGGSSIV